MDSFQVVADFAVEGMAVRQNLASKFKAKTQGVEELLLSRPLVKLPKGKLTFSVRDRQDNLTRIDRSFAVAARP